jgi:hypothetical protein
LQEKAALLQAAHRLSALNCTGPARFGPRRAAWRDSFQKRIGYVIEKKFPPCREFFFAGKISAKE